MVNTIDVNYFETAGVAIENGRAFTDADRDTSLPVAIVNEKMAHDYWPAGALGKRIQLPGEKVMRQVVGVARTANYTAWGEPPQPCAYIPLAQNDSETMVLYVRSKGRSAGDSGARGARVARRRTAESWSSARAPEARSSMADCSRRGWESGC